MTATACVFDAYGTLLDVESATARHARAIGAGAARLSELWRAKQLQYTWLRSLSGAPATFREVTREALEHSMAALGLDDEPLRDALLDAYETLDPFPEAPAALHALAARGVRLGILSNGDPDMLDAAVSSAGLGNLFEAVMSARSAGIFKTSPHVYQLAVDRLGLAPGDIWFASANCWDAHGAAQFGLRSVWINRAGVPDDLLPGEIHATLPSLEGLPRLVA